MSSHVMIVASGVSRHAVVCLIVCFLRGPECFVVVNPMSPVTPN